MTMTSTVAATRERVVRSIERSLRGITITPEQANRIHVAVAAHTLPEENR